MKRIIHVLDPQIGKYYLVPHVSVKEAFRSIYKPSDFIGVDRNYLVPIRGTLHNDPLLNFHQRHYHIDVRFVSLKNNSDDLWNHTRKAVNIDRHKYGDSKSAFLNRIIWKKRKLKRHTQQTWGQNSILKPHFCYHTARIREDGLMICPHQKAILSKSDRNPKDGTYMCPLHRLRWNENGTKYEVSHE